MTLAQRIGYAILVTLIPISFAVIFYASWEAVWTGEWRWLILAALASFYLWSLVR